MKTLDNIDRITTPDRDTFWSEYVLKQRPVVITDLFAGQPIDRVRTLPEVREHFGDVVLEVQEEFVTARERLVHEAEPASANVPKHMNTRQYLDFIDQNPDTRVMCTVYDTPARILAMCSLPKVCLIDAPEQDLFSQFFLGNVGNFAHLHFDGDHRQVLLHQIFGHKRVSVFPPQASGKLHPVLNFSTVSLENFAEQDALRYIEYCGGYDTMLRPGETIFIPMLWWHYLHYVDTAASMNFRFGRNAIGKFLCSENFHMSRYMQSIGARMVDEPAARARYGAELADLEAVLRQPAEDRMAKFRAVEATLERIYRRICPEGQQLPYYSFEFAEALEKSVALELKLSALYEPATTQRPPLVGPISPVQMRSLTELSKKQGYTDEVFSKILYNKFAKASLDALTRAEGATLLAFLNSPSGSLL